MADSTNPYEYFAFISYKREDEKWAKWLQHKLEYYKLPSSVRKDNPDLPDKIRPVFKDTTDLEPGVLAQKIQNALDSSKFLIVICSPRSANSVWVSKEVQSFIDSGRADHIIPFIIGGTPNASDSEDECFPEGLRQLAGEQELLGANINEVGREAAAIKVVARMFNLRFDTLWQRFERGRKQRQLAIVLVALFAVGISILIGGLYVDRNRANMNLDKKNVELANTIQKLSETQIKLRDGNRKLHNANDSIRNINSMLIKSRNDLKKTVSKLELTQTHLVKTISNLELTQDSLVQSTNLAVSNEKKATHNMFLAETAKAEALLQYIQLLIKNGELIEAATILNGISEDIDRYSPETQSQIYICIRNLFTKYNYGDQYDIILAHNGSICDMSFNSDGSLIATSSNDRKIRIWNTSNGELIKELPTTYDLVSDIWDNQDFHDFMKDYDSRLPVYADSCYKTFSSISTGTQSRMKYTDVSTVYLNRRVYSPDGTCYAEIDGDKVVIYADGVIRSSLNIKKNLKGKVRHMEFSYDNSRILFFVTGEVREMYAKEFSLAGSPLRQIDFSKKDCVNTHGCIYLPYSHQILSIVYEDGPITISEDGYFQPFSAPDDVRIIAIHPVANVIALGGDNGYLTLRHYIPATPAKAHYKDQLFFLNEMHSYDTGMEIYDRHVRDSYNGLNITSFEDKAFIKNTYSGEVKELKGHSNNIGNVIFNRAHDMVITRAFDKTIRFWSVDKGAEIDSLRLNIDGYGNQSIICSPDDKYLITSSDHMIHVFEISTGQTVFTLPVDEVNYSCLSEDGSRLLFTTGFHNKSKDVKYVDFLSNDNLRLWLRKKMPRLK